MSIFNLSDYKNNNTEGLTEEEGDRRYFNVEGDVVDQLITKRIQLYDTSAIIFGDSTVQTTAFTEEMATNANNIALTGITYDLSKDTTTIENRLTVKANHSWGTQLSKTAQFLLINDTVETANQYNTAIFSGVEYGVANKSKIIAGDEGATVIMNTRNNAINDSVSICLTGEFPTENRGLLINLKNSGQSRYCGTSLNQFAFQCGSVYFQSDMFLYPPNKTFINVYDTIIAQGLAITSIQSNTNIAEIQALNESQTADITDLKYKTQKLSYTENDDVSSFNGILRCSTDMYVNNTDVYGNISVRQNREKIEENKTNIAANTLAIENHSDVASKFNISGTYLGVASSISEFRLNQILNMKEYDIINVDEISFLGNNRTITNCVTIDNIKTDTTRSKSITDKFSLTGTAWMTLNKILDMNNHDMVNVKSMTLIGGSGGMKTYYSPSISTSIFKSNTSTEVENGSSFLFACEKNDIVKSVSIDYNDVNFNDRTLTGCSTIDDIKSSIDSLALSQAGNLAYKDDFTQYMRLEPGQSTTAGLGWKNHSTIGNINCLAISINSAKGHPGIIRLALPLTPNFYNYRVQLGLTQNLFMYEDLITCTSIFMLPSGQSNDYIFRTGFTKGVSDNFESGCCWKLVNGSVEVWLNGNLSYISSKYTSNMVDNWLMSVITLKSNGDLEFMLTLPNDNVASNQDIYTHPASSTFNVSDLMTPMVGLYQTSGNLAQTHVNVDYCAVTLDVTR